MAHARIDGNTPRCTIRLYVRDELEFELAAYSLRHFIKLPPGLVIAHTSCECRAAAWSDDDGRRAHTFWAARRDFVLMILGLMPFRLHDNKMLLHFGFGIITISYGIAILRSLHWYSLIRLPLSEYIVSDFRQHTMALCDALIFITFCYFQSFNSQDCFYFWPAWDIKFSLIPRFSGLALIGFTLKYAIDVDVFIDIIPEPGHIWYYDFWDDF